MGNFCLVGRIRGVPLGVLEYISSDDRGEDGGVVSLTLVADINLVKVGQLSHPAKDDTFGVSAFDFFTLVLEHLFRAQSYFVWDGLEEKFVDGLDADFSEHNLALFRGT